MSLSNGIKFWLFVFFIFCLFFWIFNASLLPFIIGLIIAYILNPAVNALENNGIRRIIATNIVLLGFIFSIVLFCLLFVPIISDQISSFVTNIPVYQAKAVTYIDNYLGTSWKKHLVIKDIDYEKYVNQYAKNVLGATGNVIHSVLVNSIGMIKNLTFLIIIPVVAFYFLLDWNLLIAKVDSWLPREYAVTIRSLILQMDELQSGFIRGQVLVCIIQALFYIIALSLIGLDYAITLGFITGILTDRKSVV